MSRLNKDIYNEYFGVKELKRVDFEDDMMRVKETVHKGLGGLIIFYAPWCNHCQAASSMLYELAQIFRGQKQICAVNCYDQDGRCDELCDHYRIREYPAFFIMSMTGELTRYQGDEVLESLYQHML